MEIADLVGKAKSGDTKAFTALVESHQNLALGYTGRASITDNTLSIHLIILHLASP
jgi:hypothetical protein